jgi:xanthine dehydrogenase accessory factor
LSKIEPRANRLAGDDQAAGAPLGEASPASDSDDVLEVAAQWRRAGRRVAIATVVATWGSSPRPVGSQLAVDDCGRFVGSVSGGCVESAVISQAQAIIATCQPRLIEYGINNRHAWEQGLACGGRVHIFLEPLEWKADLLDRLLVLRRAKHPVVVATDLDSGVQALFAGEDDPVAVEGFDTWFALLAANALKQDRSALIEEDGRRVFLHVFNPPPRLVIVGAVHIAEPLARIAALADYEVVIIDPRRAFAGRDRFAGAAVVAAWPDEALASLALDHRTAVVTLTHDPKLDDAALQTALTSPAFYIGCLGSTKTQAARLDRLRARGFGESALGRIRGPIGLPIGAKTPAEIAIAILAEITEIRRHGSKRS